MPVPMGQARPWHFRLVQMLAESTTWPAESKHTQAMFLLRKAPNNGDNQKCESHGSMVVSVGVTRPRP